MKFIELELKDFRNIKSTQLQPSPSLNFFVGNNGQGKTSLLEAIDFIATLRSFKHSKPEEVIREGSGAANIRGIVRSGGSLQNELRIVFENSQGSYSKQAYSQGKTYKSAMSYLKQRFASLPDRLHTVSFNPTDHDLIRGEPAKRRHYIDRAISAEKYEYLNDLHHYQRALTQRNAILKSDKKDWASLSVYTEKLIELGSQVTRERIIWLARLEKKIGAKSRLVAPHQETTGITYLSNIFKELFPIHFSRQEALPSLQEIEYIFRRKMQESEKTDLLSGVTLVGPHRDDWLIQGGEKTLKGHGSQGEIRTALLGLRLSEIELFQESTGQNPLFLLDDFSSELDQERRAHLLQYLTDAGLQVFITTTETQNIPESAKTFFLAHGQIDHYVDARN